MGVLHQPQTGARETLRVRHLVGRSRRCDLHLSAATVSGEHAAIWWDGGGWWVRDLASRNGTFVDGSPIVPGEPRALPLGARLGFGDPDGWILASDRSPGPQAHALDDGAIVEGSARILAIPDERQPSATLFPRRDGTWRAELCDGSQVVADLDLLVVDGRTWRLHLPEPLEDTCAAPSRAPRVDELRAEFRVSLDEETVDIALSSGAFRLELAPRAHSYALLLLARARLADAALPEGERGWIDRDALVRMLKMDRTWLNVQLHRARRQLAEQGIEGAEGLIQRRGASMRIGFAEVVEAAVDPA